MRSPNGVRRAVRRFTPHDVPAILKACDDEDERFTVKLHLTLKCREGTKDRPGESLIGLDWSQVRWEDNFYGSNIVTIDVYEPKTKGGTWWRHCPVDLWFSDLSKELRERWEKQGCPTHGRIVPLNYEQYRRLWAKISKKLGKKLEPHDCRRSPSGWLRDLGLSDLAIGNYDATSGEGWSCTGVGWENPEIFYSRYGQINPLAIFDKSKKLDVSVFDGLIHKILANV